MMKITPYLLLLILLITACKDTEKRDFSKRPDTLKLDYAANRDMFIILSILPDSLVTHYNWARNERGNMYDSERELGYAIDSTGNLQNIVKFQNDYIELKKNDISFSLRAYQIGDGEYIILSKEKTPDTTLFKGFQVYKNTSLQVPLEEAIGRYKNNFYKDATNQACLDDLNLKESDFEFDITEPNKLFIEIKTPEKKAKKDCLNGTYQTMFFSDKVGPFNLESVK
ncbi:MAG: hypothetical protein EOO85_00720 [Pedobacter sp.]|nr:MAG: hypothetical protein EOO85_00720 [Pedobacter sp.]